MDNSQAIATKLAAYDANPVTSASALNEALGQFGVPEIRNTVSGLRTTVANTTNSLNNVDPSVTGRTSGSLVTEAQRQRMVANERAPIAQQLGDQTGALTDNEKALQDALGQATTQASNKVNDYTAGRQALQGQYDIAYKRESDAAQAAAAQAAAERQQSNEDRNYQLAVQSAARSGAKASAPNKSDVSSYIVDSFNKLRGKDGKVSNETWQNALNDFTSIGGTVRQFWQNYGSYVNPKFKSSYAGYAAR